ncbi:MAG: DUF4982 domain-containing protein [Treponemataceae bacterium]|nr:DUF4982 domain-containing protein [Treponemataceae bacterium]
MRKLEKLNRGWMFILDDKEAFAEESTSEKDFRPVTIPHDWSNDYELEETALTGGGGGYGKGGVAWYRRHVEIKADSSQKVFLYFEGVYMDSTVYMNGKKIGGHAYGYSSFYADATDAVKDGDNLIAVRVNNGNLPNSRWYSGSGIQRDVYIIKTDKIHFDHFGVRINTNGIYPQDCADFQIKASVSNETAAPVNAGVLHELFDAEGKRVSQSGIALFLNPGESSDCVTRPSIKEPHLWTDEDPYLYTLKSKVLVNGTVVDEYTCKTGVRTASFDAEKGFLLNGVTTKIKGMCLHHDCGLTGEVGYRESWRRRLLKLKKMGCNGIRCSHNPPVPLLLDLCDELGFLVMDEAFDEWYLSKNKNWNYYSEQLAYGSAAFFKRDSREDMTTMLRRDYNHPSVVIWSIGNEIPEQSSEDGVKIVEYLQGICHEEDPSRMVTSACDNIVAIENIRTRREFENALDVVGYNYAGRWRERAETFYEEDKFLYPDRIMIGTENPSVGGIRGDYSLESKWGGNYAAQTMHNEPLWRYTISHDFISGDFLWTGIDYLGETAWPRRGAPCGPIDTAGFEKDSYYYFKSIWNKKETTLYLAPSHWNFQGEEGQYRPVVCYTNCDEVKLYINGKYVGSRGYECPRYGCKKAWNDCFGKHFTTNDLHLSWDVVYEPGELKAEGYKDGKLVETAVVKTSGELNELRAKADAAEISTDDIIHIELEALDKDGQFVCTANPLISCKVEGPAHLIGMDAGDLYDLSMFSKAERKMFNGRLLAMLMADGKGQVNVTFTTEKGLTSSLTFTIKA